MVANNPLPPDDKGQNGHIRDREGRFLPGTKGGPGNPYAKRIKELRQTLYGTITDQDIREVVLKLIELAKGGDTVAIRELLDRAVGKSAAVLDDKVLDMLAQRVKVIAIEETTSV